MKKNKLLKYILLANIVAISISTIPIIYQLFFKYQNKQKNHIEVYGTLEDPKFTAIENSNSNKVKNFIINDLLQKESKAIQYNDAQVYAIIQNNNLENIILDSKNKLNSLRKKAVEGSNKSINNYGTEILKLKEIIEKYTQEKDEFISKNNYYVNFAKKIAN